MIWRNKHQNKKKGNQYLVTGSVQKYVVLELSIAVAFLFQEINNIYERWEETTEGTNI